MILVLIVTAIMACICIYTKTNNEFKVGPLIGMLGMLGVIVSYSLFRLVSFVIVLDIWNTLTWCLIFICLLNWTSSLFELTESIYLKHRLKKIS